jgi:hypothetical protein
VTIPYKVKTLPEVGDKINAGGLFHTISSVNVENQTFWANNDTLSYWAEDVTQHPHDQNLWILNW